MMMIVDRITGVKRTLEHVGRLPPLGLLQPFWGE